jgi:hypothetical protein
MQKDKSSSQSPQNEALKNILIDLGEKNPSDETVRQSAHNLIGLFKLLMDLDKRTDKNPNQKI